MTRNKKVAEIKLQGPSAVVAVLVFGLFSLMGFASRSSSFEGQGKEAVISYLKSEYMREALPGLRKVVKDTELEESEQAEEVEDYLALNRVTLRSATYRGDDDHYIVRVEVRVNGATPPDGEEVRYLRMKHSHITGWSVDRDSSALSYWLAFSFL